MESSDIELEWMSSEERARYYDEKVKWIVEHAYQTAPAMREKMDKVGISPSHIQTVKDLERIPITKKDDLIRLQKENSPFGGMLGVPVEEINRIFISPGPIYDPFGDEVYSRTARILSAMGFRKGDLVVNTFSYHLVPAGLYFHEALSKLGVTVLPTGVGNTELQLQIMRELKATGYVGTPSFLMTLIKKAEELGYNFRKDFSIKTAYLASEMLPQSLRESFEKEYGINVYQAYGSADMGITAYECSAQSGMHMAEEFLIEIVDPTSGKQLGPGEIGEVVVTPLEKTRPLLRFGTGDLSVYTEEPCSCGRTSPRLLKITGRVGEAVKVRSMFVHPKELADAIGKFPQIINYRIVVNRIGHRDDVTLIIELESEDVDVPQLSENILKNVSEACRVKFDRIELLEKGTLPKEHQKIIDERTWD